MKLLNFLNKKRIVTLSLTLFLFLLYVGISALQQYSSILTESPRFTKSMLVVTMIFVLCGCIIQTLGYIKVYRVLGMITFLCLCAFVLYASTWYDFAIFGLCMYLVLHRSVDLCDSSACHTD